MSGLFEQFAEVAMGEQEELNIVYLHIAMVAAYSMPEFN